MTLQLQETTGGDTLVVHLTGKLTKADYAQYRPEVERMIQERGRIRILLDMEDFHGWNPGGFWEDLKFDFAHARHIDRLAMVGEKKWQRWMATVCKPFTSAQIQYFDRGQLEAAREWLGT